MRSLKSKMIIPIVSILVLMVVAILWFVNARTAQLADDLVDHRVNITAAAVNARLEDVKEKTRLVALSVAADYTIVSNIQDWNDRENRPAARSAIVARTDILKSGLEMDSFVIRDIEGRLVLRSHEPDTYDDFGLGEATPGATALDGTTGTSFISTSTMPLGLTTSTPILYQCYETDCPIIGSIAAIYMLDTEAFVDSFAEIFDARVSVFLGNESIMSSSSDEYGNRITGLSLSTLAYETVLRGGRELREDINLDDRNYIGYKIPLRGYNGDVIGVLVVAFSNDEALAARNELRNTVIGISANGLIVAAAAMFIFISKLLLPLQVLRDNVKSITGNAGHSNASQDELGTIIHEVGAIMLRERDAGEQLMVMLDSAPLAITLYDKDFNTITYNREGGRVFGVQSALKSKEIRGTMPTFQHDGRNSMDVFKAATDEAIKNGIYREELLCQRQNGEIFPAEITWSRVEYKGEYVLVEYTRDITEIKAAEKKEREADERAKFLLDTAPTACFLVNSHLKTIWCNRTAVELFAVQKGKTIVLDGKNCEFNCDTCHARFESEKCVARKYLIENTLKIYPGHENLEQIERFMADMFLRSSREGKLSLALDHMTLHGEIFPCETIIFPVVYHESLSYAIFTRDLREIKAVEERERAALKQAHAAAEESNRAKSKFLARMSHEIRTPITAVMGISEIELQTAENLSPRIQESFAKIHSSANLLLGIVNDILDLSKIEAGKMELAHDEYLVPNLIVDIAYLHLAFLNSRDIKFSLLVDQNLPTILLGDSLRVKQIINNLLSNAFKYTESGTVELSLQCRKTEDEFVDLIISIRDTGYGMTKEQLKILRNSEYTRFHEQENRFIGGTGLGIPIVTNLLNLMDAHMDIESEPGVGTQVVVSIPQKVANAKIIGKEAAARLQQFDEVILSSVQRFDVTPEPMPYGKVLVVDDVDANLYVSSGLLAFYELQVETCCSGSEALEKVKQGMVYDIIFLDEMMPGISGTETMHELRKMNYTHPIVALTANALIGQADEYVRAGFDNFISKPIQAGSLNMILKKYIRDKQSPEIIKAALAARKTTNAKDMESYQAELLKDLRPRFARSHKETFEIFSQSLETLDIKTAHRIAHTLKSSANLIREHALSDAANSVETALRNGETPTVKQMAELESELKRTLESIGVQSELPVVPLNKKEAAELLEKLAPLLHNQNAAALDYLDDLRRVPEAAGLVRCIEDFDFRGANKVLRGLL
ncbi:MAG: ATP-binding protein [Defluviitaleaceae bacterium]|nr:ATP-binding protein [Defluviitaleaceae bacterium]